MRAYKIKPLALLRTIGCALHTANDYESYPISRNPRERFQVGCMFSQEA